MDKIYYILIGILIFAMIYMITDDNCSFEKFTQINDGSKVCNNEHAMNYTKDSNNNIDNSFCNFSANVICHRPFASNFNNNKYDNSRCSDIRAYNYEEEKFITDSSNNKIPVKKNDLDDLGKYCGISTEIDAIGKVFKQGTQEQMFKVQKCPSLDNCKYIENKTCRYPMANVKINTLKGLTSNNEEYNDLILKQKMVENNNKSEMIDLDTYELMPGNLLTVGPFKSRANFKKLYTRLFNNNGSFAKNEGLNLWDINGKIELNNLVKSDIIDSYLDNNGNIISRKGYSLNVIPKNYYELVYLMKEKKYHVALSVNSDATKYAIGVGSTKSEAADIALIRCITYISLKEMIDLFKSHKNILVNFLHNKLNLVKQNEAKTGIWNAIKGSIGADSNIIINPETSDKLKDISNSKRSNLVSNDAASLGKMALYLSSHKDIVEAYKIQLNKEQFSEITCKIKGTHNGKVCSNKPSIDELFNYIYFKAKSENINKPCGLFMIDEKRYVNVDLDSTFIENSSNCNILDIENRCTDPNKKDCQEVAVIGYNSKNDKCQIYQESKDSLYDQDENIDFRKLPKLNPNNEMWINEKEDIMKNDNVELILDTIKKCKKTNDKCILYKNNGQVSSYNSFY